MIWPNRSPCHVWLQSYIKNSEWPTFHAWPNKLGHFANFTRKLVNINPGYCILHSIILDLSILNLYCGRTFWNVIKDDWPLILKFILQNEFFGMQWKVADVIKEIQDINTHQFLENMINFYGLFLFQGVFLKSKRYLIFLLSFNQKGIKYVQWISK